jgi:hypothetical protein
LIAGHRLDWDAFFLRRGILIKNFVFALVVKTHSIRDWKFYECTPEITPQARKEMGIGAESFGGTGGRKEHIASNANLKGHSRCSFDKVDKATKTQFSFAKGRGLLNCFANDPSLD